ncbi:hypothetical protein [Ureibacillus manganicus]|uniref:Uncharacterized protein n=1 Tax=Ureibacillus manganicus DSM 26584 TaxID=1384049 RepID=A0A0A3HWC2_9BACL|nr:hypothetical protein [Ureibacillus manganicus]KGR76729.1 hypothetical protein CD29_16420 [Ureibacillus manganicus DSM 26584]
MNRKRLKFIVLLLGVVLLSFFLYNYRYGDTTIPEIAQESYQYSTIDSLTAGFLYVIEGDQQFRINLIEDEAKKIIEALRDAVVQGTDETYSPKRSETQYLISLEDPKMKTEHISFSIYHDPTQNEAILFPFIVTRFKPEQYIAKTDYLYRTITSIVTERASSN